MTISSSKKRILIALVLTASLGLSTIWAQTGGPSTAPAPVPAPAPNLPGPNDPIAKINGREINTAAFNSILMQVAGWRVFRQVFELTLVQGACSVEGIAINGDDFEKRIKEEYQHTLDTMGVGPEVTEEQRPKILDQMLAQRGVTLIEFRIGLETRAGLRALSKGRTEAITDTELMDMYNSRNGKRVAIRIFSPGNDSTVAAKLRDFITNKGLSPEAAAVATGIAQPESITIPENAKVEDIDDIKKMAFSTKEGQLSLPFNHPNPADKTKTQLIMVFVDKVFPESTTKFADAKPEVKKTLRDLVQTFKENQWMEKRLNLLRANAVVEINDPYLKQQYNAIVQAMSQSTTQPSIPGIPDNVAPTTMNSAGAATRSATRPN